MKNFVFAAALMLSPGTTHALEQMTLFTSADLSVMVPIYQQMTSDLPAWRTDLSTLTVDLDGDGESEVLMRDESRCSAASHCRIVIGKFDAEDAKWKTIGETYGSKVAFRDQEDGFKDITISSYANAQDAYFTYMDGTYQRDLSRYGDQVMFTDVEEAFEGKESYLERVLSRGLGSRYLMIQQATSEDDRALIGGADLNYDGETEYLIYADYAAVCDDDGCPLLIYSDLGKRPFAVLHSPGPNVVVSDKVVAGSLKSVVTPDGTFSWSTTGYEFEAFQ